MSFLTLAALYSAVVFRSGTQLLSPTLDHDSKTGGLSLAALVAALFVDTPRPHSLLFLEEE